MTGNLAPTVTKLPGCGRGRGSGMTSASPGLQIERDRGARLASIGAATANSAAAAAAASDAGGASDEKKALISLRPAPTEISDDRGGSRIRPPRTASSLGRGGIAIFDSAMFNFVVTVLRGVAKYGMCQGAAL